MPFLDLPPTSRPRERLLREGTEALTDHELLAVVLGVGGSHGGGPLTTARRVLARFKDLSRVASAGTSELCAIPGVGPVQACRIRAALALAARMHREPVARGDSVASPAALFQRAGRDLLSRDTEVFVALALDARHRILGDLRTEGGFCSVEIVPRDVFARLVREGAVAAVFLHNHPSGDPTPSQSDTHLTSRLSHAGSMVGVHVLDHLIVGRDRYYSFAEQRSFRA